MYLIATLGSVHEKFDVWTGPEIIDNRLCQMAFFVFAKVGKGGAKSGFRVEIFRNKKSFIFSSLFSYYIKQIDSML